MESSTVEDEDRLHRALLLDIANDIEHDSNEYHNLLFCMEGYVGKGLLSSKKSVIQKLTTLVTKGIITPGKDYKNFKQICKDSGNNKYVATIEDYEEKMKQVLFQEEKQKGNASQGSHQKRKLTHDSPEPEFQPRPSTSKSDFSRKDAIQNAYSDDADPPKKRKYRSESSELEVTDLPPRPSTIMCDFGLNEGVENVVPGCFIKKEEKNYMYAFILLQHTRDVLVPFCGEIIKHQHQTLLQTVKQKCNIDIMTCSVCEIQTLSPYHVRTKKNSCPLRYHHCNCLKSKETYECPTKVCGAIYDELIKLHICRSPYMMKLDISKLYEDPWEVNKCFIPYICNSNSLEDTDITGILHIIINSKSFNDRLTTMDLFYELREMRNNLMHCPTLELGDSEFASYETCLMNLLNIPELKSKPETHKALKSYEKIKKGFGVATFFNEVGYRHVQSLIYRDLLTNDLVDENMRVVVLGSDDQGKTSLVRMLLGQDFEHMQPTEEIDVYQCIVKPNGDWEVHGYGRYRKCDIQIWDVGGNFVNYATHQVFFSTQAIYIIEFNLKKGLEAPAGDSCNFGKHSTNTVKDNISHWVNSIHTFVGTKDGNSPQIILVGTQSDGVQYDSNKIFGDITAIFCKSYAFNHLHQKLFTISNTNLNFTDISQLRSTILDLGRSRLSKQKTEKIPTKWKELANRKKS